MKLIREPFIMWTTAENAQSLPLHDGVKENVAFQTPVPTMVGLMKL